MREVRLESGATLRVSPAPFDIAKSLYQALLAEMRSVPVNAQTDMVSIFKDIYCIGLSSKEVERYLWLCMERCQYNSGKGNLKIEPDTFEPVEARADFVQVCMEVAKENVGPFVKNLYAAYVQVSDVVENARK
jgi:hypothetical protein